MRKITLFTLLFQFVFLPLAAQTVLTYSTHGMNKGDVITLKEVKAVAPTNEGTNQVWDFSTAELGSDYIINYNEDKTSYIDRAPGTPFDCLEGNDRKPYFHLTPTSKLYYGVEGNGVKITFDKPLVELKYPFRYNDEINGTMTGIYTENNISNPITGNYSVKADAWGTIILPDGKQIDNVLRIKSVRDYNHEVRAGVRYYIKVTRYAFYSSNSRYAVFQVQDVQYSCDCNNGYDTKITTAYYNTSIKENKISPKNTQTVLPVDALSYTIYPNPFETDFTVDYKLNVDANVRISIVDLNGKEIKLLSNAKQARGSYCITDNIIETGDSVLILRIQVGDQVYTEKLTKK